MAAAPLVDIKRVTLLFILGRHNVEEYEIRVKAGLAAAMQLAKRDAHTLIVLFPKQYATTPPARLRKLADDSLAGQPCSLQVKMAFDDSMPQAFRGVCADLQKVWICGATSTTPFEALAARFIAQCFGSRTGIPHVYVGCVTSDYHVNRSHHLFEAIFKDRLVRPASMKLPKSDRILLGCATPFFIPAFCASSFDRSDAAWHSNHEFAWFAPFDCSPAKLQTETSGLQSHYRDGFVHNFEQKRPDEDTMKSTLTQYFFAVCRHGSIDAAWWVLSIGGPLLLHAVTRHGTQALHEAILGLHSVEQLRAVFDVCKTAVDDCKVRLIAAVQQTPCLRGRGWLSFWHAAQNMMKAQAGWAGAATEPTDEQLLACDDHREVVLLLLHHGASVTTADACGALPLHYAWASGNLAVITALLAKDVDVQLNAKLTKPITCFGASSPAGLTLRELFLKNSAMAALMLKICGAAVPGVHSALG